ncbi:helix-turn-helix domain-containing protein [Bacterioplanoides sp. SCSIO 12839]|uniref:helix-turn-helix domain-containing protein n=1 Tax=Bacterioplanoides sp. SCSIO 12839 TaxID=2829569 RepID=UPI0021021CC2|nr:helix-turn-helix domain-containing protein [Bacterioplanoides sp. SCSIO 12839]UTW47090.1 AraC family transcriptional regulator [Bacterioplanoides sp. SCSIO 12839]
MEWVYWTLMAVSFVLFWVVLSIRCRSRLWLSGYMAFVIGYLGLIQLDAQDFYISPKLYFCLLPIVFLPGPLLLGYISHISTRSYVGLKDFAICLLPLAIVVSAPGLLTDQPMFSFATQADYQQPAYISLFNLVSMMAGVQTIAYVIASFWLMATLRRDWASYQSKTLPRSWRKMMNAILVILITTVTQVTSAFMNPSGNALSLGDIGFMILVAFFLCMAIETAWRNYTGVPIEDEVILQNREIVAVLPEDTSHAQETNELPDSVVQAVFAQVEEQQLFLQDDLSLSSLAEQLGTTTHKLSELINKGGGKTFYEFINDFRVRYAAAKLLEQPGMAIVDVYVEAGFSSKTTFYGHFKKVFACTPTEYRKINS